MPMSALAKLKIVSVAAGQKSPTVLLRAKLTAHLVEQIGMEKRRPMVRSTQANA